MSLDALRQGMVAASFAVALLLAGCAARSPHGAPNGEPNGAPHGLPAGGGTAPANGDVMTLQSLPPVSLHIDPSRSEIRVLVYRAGPFARFGHNHVLVNRMLSGVLDAQHEPNLWLAVPAAGFTVDDAEARRAAGEDFPPDVPEDAKAGTRHNMLSAAVLNAATFPEITVSASGLQRGADGWTATIFFRVVGHETSRLVPFTVTRQDTALSVAGALDIKQSELGMTPYSLMGGALQVQDGLHIEFTLTALP
jgi:hypothetical protein